MRYSPALLEGFLQMHESLIWTLTGRFDSQHMLTGRRQRRKGCLIATPWRLLFVRITRNQIQLESITFAQMESPDQIYLDKSLLYRTLNFQASGNACRMRCFLNQPVDLNMYWLRQRVHEIQTRLPWHTEDQAAERACGQPKDKSHE